MYEKPIDAFILDRLDARELNQNLSAELLHGERPALDANSSCYLASVEKRIAAFLDAERALHVQGRDNEVYSWGGSIKSLGKYVQRLKEGVRLSSNENYSVRALSADDRFKWLDSKRQGDLIVHLKADVDIDDVIHVDAGRSLILDNAEYFPSTH